MTPEFVYFDLGNVLLTFDNQRACRQMAEAAGVDASAVTRFFDETGYAVRLELGAVAAEEVYDEFCRRFQVRPSFTEIRHAGCDMFGLLPEMLPLVARLAAAGIRLGILSNTSAVHWEHVSDGRFRFLREYFSVLALSYRIGAMKPSVAIYREATRLGGVAPEAIFFTDDRPEHVVGARQAGWQAVPFENPNQIAEELHQRGVQFYF